MDPLARRWPPVIEVIDEEMARVIRAKSGAERLAIADAMFSDARKMLMSQLRVDHPDCDVAQIQREAAWRMSHGAV